ncbi:dihydrofolate reductase [Marinilabilia rubra]|uniref:Dihydrofolate reductase n=1 Tax=Marinilabilia rubra TaxID=2162893 RepID=A0A2U2BD69_9BACT|nr:dihydrofolate reductase [Marinilabilia rubra]PWE01014.1 dihydrofolate reductase [Marinilabilia rubra]
MHISLIVATDKNNGIGINGDQPAFISEDLKRFKALTTGNTIVMGRKTYQALPKGALPNRRNIVLTRQKDFFAPGCDIISHIEEIKNICSADEKVFIIGGGEIYKLFFSEAREIYLTLIHYSFEGIDTWFPEISPDQWEIVKKEGPYTDPKNGLSYSYLNYNRK